MPRVAMEEALAETEGEELALPEREFTYPAGDTERPWEHFLGRWSAMRGEMARMLQARGSDRPLRVVDVGSCTGFFSLQAAYRHPEADVVAIEGSVGIGNGTVGVEGSARNILSTNAVQTHLRWIQRLGLPNCFVAPEVWDYRRVCELASLGRPICDVMFLLSVVHHIHNISVQQYASAGLSELDGFISLMGKILLLSPNHFIELPARPWLSEAYDTYVTPRAILDAAVKASGIAWNFRGPIYVAEWFGRRELWVLEVATPMPGLDLQSCPFPLLYRGEERELAQEDPAAAVGLGLYGDRPPEYGGLSQSEFAAPPRDGYSKHPEDSHALFAGDGWDMPRNDTADTALLAAAGELPDGGRLGLDATLSLAACPHLGGTLVDPGLMILIGGPTGPVSDRIAQAVAAAPTQLLIAHLTLREAMSEAESVLREVRGAIAHPADDRSRQAENNVRTAQPPQRSVARRGSHDRGMYDDHHVPHLRC
mmetsp:Transcript_48912/g.126117  ORF Transcript_48912/g.126117 Transcript_48912/m.126117 type:complete len:481 (+) Transcript_48912:93-1535(+)